jgi:ASC-1-like (ASCH) protein
VTINTAIVFFEKLSKESDDITEIKVYDTFIAVLSELDTKALKPEHRQSIEASLEHICVFVAVDNRTKHFKKELNVFLNI